MVLSFAFRSTSHDFAFCYWLFYQILHTEGFLFSFFGWELIHGRKRKSMDVNAIYSAFLTWKVARVLQL